MEELARLYHELAREGAPSVGRHYEWPYEPASIEALLTLGCEMVRHDPRLLSILLHWFIARWNEMNPRHIRERMSEMRWPQALLVVVTFARAARPHDVELRYFSDYLSAGWHPVTPPQRFFFEVERPGSRRAIRRQGRSLVPYSKWGFIGTERAAADIFEKELVGRYDAATRQRIAAELAVRGPFPIRRYLDAIEGSVTRAQARDDLRAAGLVVSGRGRGARWSRRGE